MRNPNTKKARIVWRFFSLVYAKRRRRVKYLNLKYRDGKGLGRNAKEGGINMAAMETRNGLARRRLNYIGDKAHPFLRLLNP